MTVGFAYKKALKVSGRGRNLNNRTSIAAWWRFKTNITNISGKCSSWRDVVNGQLLAQATASARPSVASDGSLVFDGSAQFLRSTFTLAQPFTVYLAFKQISWTSNDVVFDGVTADAKVTQTSATPQLTANGGSALAADSTIAVGSMGVIAVVFSNTAGRYQAAGGAASVTTSGTIGANSAGGITLAADRAGANFANIQALEMIVYSTAHSAADRLPILRYLARVAQVGGVT